MDRAEQIAREIKDVRSCPDVHEYNADQIQALVDFVVSPIMRKAILELDVEELARFLDIFHDRFPEEYDYAVFYSIAQLGLFDDPDDIDTDVDDDHSESSGLTPELQDAIRGIFKEEEQFCSGKRRSLYSFIDEDNCGTMFPPNPKYLPKWSELSEKQKFDAFYQCNIREMWGQEVFEEAKALSESSGVPLGWMNFQT